MAALPPANYKTWLELVDYARLRAKHSIARNGHQEAAYWVRIMRWASDMEAQGNGPRVVLHASMTDVKTRRLSFEVRAERYARAVHCRKMLLNCGEKVKRLSLYWLREATNTL